METENWKVIKRNNELVDFKQINIEEAILGAAHDLGVKFEEGEFTEIMEDVIDEVQVNLSDNAIGVEDIQDIVENVLIDHNYMDVAKQFIRYRYDRKKIREFVESKEAFIEKYKHSSNNANATVDDNSNVASKNIATANNEIHKEDNIQTSRGMIMRKLKELYPNDNPKQYLKDLESHIIYKHDESSFAGAIAPYCCSISLYPFLNSGIKELGGLSAAPKNLDSFCGIYINLIFAVSSQFAGAVATSEFLLYFDYFARKEWGEDYYKHLDNPVKFSIHGNRTIKDQIHQHFQQVVYSINQPTAARGMQSAFVNFSYFDKPFFEGMFENFYFPDGSAPKWESLCWLQKEFMQWFNQERLKTILTFPVESFAMVYKDGHFLDQDSADFVAEEYARGHSFFTYISDSVDSLSSCCRLRNSLTTKEFNFTNGNLGVETGSKSVITLNLNRIVQDYFNIDGLATREDAQTIWREDTDRAIHREFESYLERILERVYKYHHAYNELLWDVYDSKLLPVYSAGFITLNKQYLTIGINGLNEAAEFLGIKLSDNKEYQDFCQTIFSTIKECNTAHKVDKGHKMMFNTECVPAESLAVKNYNWDKADGYWVPENRNLYASYIFLPSDESVSILEKIRMHGKNYIGDYLDGGSAAHLNLDHHLSTEQYKKILKYAAEEGCQYLTFNIPNCECKDCGFIAKQPFTKCPKCSSEKTILWDRVIGYLSAVPNWSQGRQLEQKTRKYEVIKDL